MKKVTKMTTFAAVSAFSSDYCKIPTHSWLEIFSNQKKIYLKNFNQQESHFYGGDSIVCCTSIVVIGQKQLHVACTCLVPHYKVLLHH